jgi:hypothetical protein
MYQSRCIIFYLFEVASSEGEFQLLPFQNSKILGEFHASEVSGLMGSEYLTSKFTYSYL